MEFLLLVRMFLMFRRLSSIKNLEWKGFYFDVLISQKILLRLKFIQPFYYFKKKKNP